MRARDLDGMLDRMRAEIGLILGLAATLGFASAGTAVAQDGNGDSHWGPIPAESDSLRARYLNRPLSGWEWPLYAPWKVVSLPFELVNLTVKGLVVTADRTGLVETLEHNYPLRLGAGYELSFSAALPGAVTGFAFGANLENAQVRGPYDRFQARAFASVRGANLATVGYAWDDPGGRFCDLGVGYRKRPRARFFGLGPRSEQAHESYFTQEEIWAGLRAWTPVLPGVRVEAAAAFTNLESRSPGEPDEDPPLDVVFDGDLPTGYGDRTRGFQFSLALQRDDSDHRGRPRHGGLQRASLGYFSPTSRHETDFWTYRVEAQQFLSLWYDRALALRGVYTWSDESDMHFQRMPVNNDPDLFRGYDEFRWRDRGLTAITVEYRYPVWSERNTWDTGLDAYLFFDWGQVFSDHRQIDIHSLTESYGLGFRLVNAEGFSARAEVGFSEEDTVFRLSGSQTFQFEEGGYYDGRSPVPLR